MAQSHWWVNQLFLAEVGRQSLLTNMALDQYCTLQKHVQGMNIHIPAVVISPVLIQYPAIYFVKTSIWEDSRKLGYVVPKHDGLSGTDPVETARRDQR